MSIPESFPKNISSPSLKPEISLNPSSASNKYKNNNNINQNKINFQINEENDDATDNMEEKEIDEIAEEEDELDDKNKENEKEEIQPLNANQEKRSKIERLFIYLRTGFVWRPIPKIKSTVLCLEISGGIFLIIGIVILILSNQIKEIEIRYDNNPECIIGQRCNINFSIKEEMQENVFV